MKKLYNLVLKEFAGPLLMTFFIVEFLLIMQFLWRHIEDLAGKGLSFGIFLELMFYAAASLVPLSLPLAILLASLMTFGNLGENYELTAIKSAGISLTKIMKPLFYILSVVSLLALLYSNITLPYFNMKMKILLYDINDKRPEIMIKEGIFFNGIDNYSIKAGKKNSKTGMLYNIIIYDHTSNSNGSTVTVADSGLMRITADKRKLIVILHSGYSYCDVNQSSNKSNKTYPFRRDQFKKQTVNIELTGFNLQRTEDGVFKNHYQMMNMKQLNIAIDSFRNEFEFDKKILTTNLIGEAYPREIPFKSPPKPKIDTTLKDTLVLKKDTIIVKKLNILAIFDSLSLRDKNMYIEQTMESVRGAKNVVSTEASIRTSKIRRMHKHEIEWHKKFTLSVACIVFFFLGAPLGAIIRKGGLGLPLVISVLFFIFYYIITLTGEKMVRESIFTPFGGMWLASFILLPLGIFITYKATHDSSLLNIESYIKLYNKWVKQFTIFVKNKFQAVKDEDTNTDQ